MPNPEDLAVPPITEQMREQARSTPDSWLYIVDPAYQDGSDDIPPEGIMGAYRIDSDGEVEPQFHRNDQYVPSDDVFTLPEATNALEEVLNQIALGNAPDTELPPAIIEAELLLYASDEDTDAIFAAEMSDGSKLVPACTSASRVPENWPGYRAVAGHQLAELLSGLDLGLNLDDDVRAVIPHAVLVEASAARDI